MRLEKLWSISENLASSTGYLDHWDRPSRPRRRRLMPKAAHLRVLPPCHFQRLCPFPYLRTSRRRNWKMNFSVMLGWPEIPEKSSVPCGKQVGNSHSNCRGEATSDGRHTVILIVFPTIFILHGLATRR